MKKTATVEKAAIRLAEFDAKWSSDYPSIAQSWRRIESLCHHVR